MAIELVAPVKELEAISLRLQEAGHTGAYARVVARAANRALATGKSHIVKTAAKELGILQRRVRRRIWVTRMTQSKLEGKARASSLGWGLIYFGTQQTKTGVTVSGAGKASGSYAHAFINKYKSGHEAVLQRFGKSRYPIGELMTPSVSQEIEQVGASPEIIAAIQETFVKRLSAETELIISGVRG